MNFKVGNRVTLLRTGKTGTVSAILGDDNYQVRLDGGMGHLPAPGHALALMDGGDPAPASDAPLEEQKSVPAGNGVQLAFDPLFNEAGEPERYQLYLLNSTPAKVLYEIKVRTADRQQSSKFGPLGAGEKLRLQTVPYAWLNERLQIDLDVREVREGGTGPRHFQQVKIRPKQFFGSFREVPELNHGAHLLVVFPRLKSATAAEDAAPRSTLRELTRAQMKTKTVGAPTPARAHSLSGQAEFDPVLDLHLEALVADPTAVGKDKILGLQMDRFDRFIDQALRLDVPRVLIVHGLGNGILKTEIHQKLEHVPFVRQFANDYHPKYGYGATEVLFDS